jgi:RimJ/RimL family protein N-acetyltransferase
VIRTDRLDLVPATPDLARAALAGQAALASALGVAVPPSWPPEYNDDASFQFTVDQLLKGTEQEGWWMHLVVLRSEKLLIGTVGYKGPPSADGTVELGYGIVNDHRRKGYATEAVKGLVSRALAESKVRRVIAETFPALTPSIGVLRKCGFEQQDVPGSAPGIIRFELTRP